jgi:hypothetical protein
MLALLAEAKILDRGAVDAGAITNLLSSKMIQLFRR